MNAAAAIWRMVFLLVMLGSAGLGSAQSHSRKVKSAEPVVFLDSGFIISTTLQVMCKDSLLLPQKDYALLADHHHIKINAAWLNKELIVSYAAVSEDYFRVRRVYPMRVDVLPSSIYDATTPTAVDGTSQSELQTDGVLLRGISFGNAQDLVMNSSLNLRMGGNIAENLYVEGALTDQEYPFQPEGTTSSIQDFDRVYIKAQSKKISVTLGDYAFVGLPDAWYSKFAKKNRGIQLQFTDAVKGWKTHIEGNAALARGRFSRNEIAGKEGLQGPYRLSGSRNEPFIIVVSGTEVVYLDGKRMERGYQADYTIDYNLGEVTFTPRRLIAQNSRIVVEFQYTDRFYSRMVGATMFSAEKNRFTYYASVYKEGDLPAQPLQQDLTLFDSSRMLDARSIMALAGDNQSASVMTGAVKIADFNYSAPNYWFRDSAGISFYQYQSTPDSVRQYYRVNFSYVGAKKGNYVLSATTANGKVYRFMPPVSGVLQGDYEPVQLLRTPNSSSLSEVGVIWKIMPGNSIKLSGSQSSQDNNLFSGLDDKDNRGRALAMEWKQMHVWKQNQKDSSRRWFVKNNVKSEWNSSSFKTIERFRDVEFGRLWNRELFNPENATTAGNNKYLQHMLEAGNRHVQALTRVGVNHFGTNEAKYLAVKLRANYQGWFLEPEWETSNGAVSQLTNQFNQKKIAAGVRKKYWSAAFNRVSEESLFNGMAGLTANSYRFQQSGLNMDAQSGRITWSVEATDRLNFSPANLLLERASRVGSLGSDLKLNTRKSGFLKVGYQFRNMRLLDSSFREQFAGEKHTAARMEWSFPALSKRVSGNVFYQTLSAREQQRQFAYFEVPAGQGFYTWKDFNANGVQEVSEFVETPFKDQARFVRLLLPTGNFVKAQSVEFNGNLMIRTKNSAQRLQLSNRTGWNYQGRNIAKTGMVKFFPVFTPLSSDNILAANALIRNQAELEGGKWSTQLTSLLKGYKTLFGQGQEWRKTNVQTVFQRLDIKQKWQLRSSLEWKSTQSSSAIQPANAFAYQNRSAEPMLVLQVGSSMRISGGLRYAVSDTVSGSRLATQQDYSLAITRSIGSKGMLDVRFSRVKFNYTGESGTALAYDVMQGFTPGSNLRINTELRMTLSGNVQLLLNYEARKTAEQQFIHIGRAEARYLF